MPITLSEVAAGVEAVQRKFGRGGATLAPGGGFALMSDDEEFSTFRQITIEDVEGLEAALDGLSPTVSWDSITGKPSTFPPSSHTHAIGDVTNLQSSLNALAGQLAIGGAIGNSPASGGLLFPNASGQLAQDAANLSYSSASGVLTLKRRLAIGANAAYGTDPLNFYDSFGTFDQVFQIVESITDCAKDYIMGSFAGIELNPSIDPACYVGQGGQSGITTKLGNTRNFAGMDLVGYEYYAQHNATSAINGLLGLSSFVGKGSATLTCADMTSMRIYGLIARGGAVTTGHGLWIQGVQNGGAVYSNFYGLRISNQYRAGQTDANCFAIHTAGGRVWFMAGNAAVVPLTAQAAASQLANIQDWRDSIAVVASITKNGGFRPASMADSAAENSTLYYSTTASKLVYKDGSGTVNALY